MSQHSSPVEYKRVIAKIQKLLNFYHKTCFDHIDVTNMYVHGESEEDRRIAATTYVGWEYRRCTITWFLPVLKRMDDEELEETVVHELCHTITDPMIWDKCPTKVWEYSTQSTALALLRLKQHFEKKLK